MIICLYESPIRNPTRVVWQMQNNQSTRHELKNSFVDMISMNKSSNENVSSGMKWEKKV